MKEWQPIETAPKCSSPIELKVKLDSGPEYIVKNVTWSAPIDVDDHGNEYYCYDDCGWWHEDYDEYDADWVEYAGQTITHWRPQFLNYT